jgi:hypothetical protein
MKKSTVHTLTYDSNMLLSEDHIKKFNELIERSGFKIKEEQDMETIGTGKAKKKFTLEEWKKEADAARKRAVYWKKQSDQWEGRFFLVQDSIGGEIEAINKKLESTETQLKWAHEGNQELVERCKKSEAIELVAKAEIKAKNVEISLLKSDFETKQSELEIIEEDYNQFKADSRHTRTLAWVGWIMFFTCLFGMIFLKP